MPNLVSSKTVSAQDLQNLKYTIDTYDDGTTRLRVSGNAAPGTAGTPSVDVTSVQGATGGTPVPSSDSGPAWTTVPTRTSSADMTTAANISGVPTSGQKLVVTDVVISTDTAMRFDLLEESNATPRYSFYMAANSSYQFTPRGKFKLPTADKHLQGKASVAGNVSITTLTYAEA